MSSEAPIEGPPHPPILTYSSGPSQGIALGDLGHDTLLPTIALSGGKVRVDQFNYQPILHVVFTAGLLVQENAKKAEKADAKSKHERHTGAARRHQATATAH